MKKIIRVLTLPLFLFLVTFAVHAQSPAAATTPAAGGLQQVATCVQVEWCGDAGGNCSAAAKAGPGFDPYHTVRITPDASTKPLSVSQTYLADCLSVGADTVCTTGTSANDMKVFGTDNLTYLKTNIAYNFELFAEADGVTPATNPITTTATGDFAPHEMRTSTKAEYAHRWIAISYFSNPTTTVGNAGGQQQGTLNFATAAFSCSAKALTWDPYGRTFDSKTLEPLNNITVEVDKKATSGALTRLVMDTPGWVNPQSTKVNGSFSFFVPDGTYQLVAKDPTGAYEFPLAAGAQFGAGYASVYKELYPTETGSDIVVAGGIQHRDIPMSLVAGHTAQNNPVKVMSVFTDLNKVTNMYNVQGQVSHPFVTMNVWVDQVTPTGAITKHTRIAATSKTDKDGKFALEVPMAEFAAGEVVGDLEAVKSTQPTASTGSTLWSRFLSMFNIAAHAQSMGATATTGSAMMKEDSTRTATVALKSIPNYLEGYAYDAAGKAIPNATVSVYLESSVKPMYTTQADATGFFKVTSEHLPFLAYSLKYTSATGAVTAATTEKFIQQNLPYITQNNVKLNTFKDANGNGAVKPTEAAAANAQPTGEMSPSGAAGSNNIIVAVVLLVVVVVIGVIVGMYLLKKSKSPDMTV
jgi:hypothetical protein